MVTETIAKQFAGYAVRIAEQSVTENGTTYKMQLSKVNEKITVEVSDKGVVINKEKGEYKDAKK